MGATKSAVSPVSTKPTLMETTTGAAIKAYHKELAEAQKQVGEQFLNLLRVQLGKDSSSGGNLLGEESLQGQLWFGTC